MTTDTKRRPRLARVTAEEHRRLGLLPGWRFFHAPADAGLICRLCRQPAAFVSRLRAVCERHARDF